MPIAALSSNASDGVRLRVRQRLSADSIRFSITGEELLNVALFSYLGMNGGIHVPLGNLSLLNLIDHQSAAFFWAGSVWLFVRNGTRVHWQLWSCKLAFLFLGYTVLSILWSDSPLRSTWYPTTTSICTFLYYNYLLDRYKLYEAVRMMTWSFTFLLSLSLLARVVAPTYALDDGIRDPHNLGALQGIFNQKNILAVVTTLSFAVALGLSPRTHSDRVSRVTLLLLSVVCAWQSQSREGWAAMAAVVPLALLMTLTSRMHLRSRLPIMLLALGVLLGTGCLLYYNLDAMLHLLDRTRDASGRTEIWSAVSLMIARRPWFGYGTWGVWETPRAWDAVVRAGWSVTSSHNNYLEIILSYGYVGFSLYLAMMLFSIYFMGRALLTGQTRDSRVLIYVMVSIFILSFAVVLMMFSPSVGMILLLYCMSHLERVESSGFMSLRSSNY